MTSPYQMEINNAAQYILDNNPDNPKVAFPNVVTIFEFSTILGICHCKDKGEVAQDILNAQTVIMEKEKQNGN